MRRRIAQKGTSHFRFYCEKCKRDALYNRCGYCFAHTTLKTSITQTWF